MGRLEHWHGPTAKFDGLLKKKAMTLEEKQELANKILDITTRPNLPQGKDMDEHAAELIQKIMDKRISAMAEVYAKIYTDEQLQALFDFHYSEIGQSIHQASSAINKEMRRREPELNKQAETKEFNSLEFHSIKKSAAKEDQVPLQQTMTPGSKTSRGIGVGLVQGSVSGNVNKVYEYKLKIFSVDEDAEEVEVNLVISTNEELEMFTLRTPIEYEFSTSRYYIFYDTLDKGIDVRAELYSNEMEKMGLTTDGGKASHSGSSGRGRFINDPRIPLNMNGGG